MGLETVLGSLVREGDLTLRLPGGREVRLGDRSGPRLIARITSAGWAARIAAKPGLQRLDLLALQDRQGPGAHRRA